MTKEDLILDAGESLEHHTEMVKLHTGINQKLISKIGLWRSFKGSIDGESDVALMLIDHCNKRIWRFEKQLARNQRELKSEIREQSFALEQLEILKNLTQHN